MESSKKIADTREVAFQHLVRSVTFRLDAPNSQGTGFFISKDLAVTARHVISKLEPQNDVRGIFNGQSIEFRISDLFWDEFAEYDLALLQLKGATVSACAFLDADAKLGDVCWICGFTKRRPEGDSATAEIESCEKTQIKVKAGQIEFGFSGSPAANLTTGGIVGVTVISRDPQSSLGGLVLSDGNWIKYCHSPRFKLRENKRISGRPPVNYFRRDKLLNDVVSQIVKRTILGRQATVVVRGPSGYGKTSFADDLIDQLEVELACDAIRIRCLGLSPGDVRDDGPVLCDGLNDLNWPRQEMVRWLERLGSPRVITTSDIESISILRKTFLQVDDLDSFTLIDLPPLSAEETLSLVRLTHMPCAIEPNSLGNVLQSITLGSPFLIQFALDLVCSDALNVLPEDLRDPLSYEKARKQLFETWRSTWLSKHPGCQAVANTLCLTSKIGLSEAALSYLFGGDIDIKESLKLLANKGFISKADIFDQTYIPHALLRQAFAEARLVMSEDFTEKLSKALLAYAEEQIFYQTGPIKDPLTIIEAWMLLVRSRFVRQYSAMESKDKISPYVQFSNDMIGELARRGRGIGSHDWQAWLVNFFRTTLREWGCQDKIPLSQAILRVAPSAVFGDAFSYGWQVRRRRHPKENVDSAGDAYCLLASVGCWLNGDATTIESAKEQLRVEWGIRRALGGNNFNNIIRLAFSCAFMRLNDYGMAEAVLLSCPNEERPDLVASLILTCLAKKDISRAEQLKSRFGYELRSSSAVALIFLSVNNMALEASCEMLEFNPSWSAYMAFASGNDLFRDAFYATFTLAKQGNDGWMTIDRSSALKAVVEVIKGFV